MSERDAGYICDMVEAITKIEEFVQNKSYDEYLNSHLIQGAVERKLEFLGEAAGRVTEETRQKRPQVD